MAISGSENDIIDTRLKWKLPMSPKSDLIRLQNQSADELESLLQDAKNDTERLPILTALGWVLAISDTGRAKAFNDDARAINATHDDAHYHAHIACNDARCLLYQNEYIQALSQLDEAQHLYDQAGDHSYRGGYLDLTRAIILTYMSDKQEAQAAAERVVAIAENTENRLLMASALTIMGSLAGSSGKPDLAREWFLRCLTIYQAEGDTRNIGKTYNNLSRIYIDQEQYEAALEAAEMALIHHQRAGYRFGEMFPHNLMGEIYAATGQLANAKHHYERALQIAEAFEHLGLQVAICYQLARIQHQSGNIDVAIEGYKEAIALCPPDLETASLRDAHKQLAACFEQLGDYRQGMIHLWEYARIQEKLTDEEVEKAVARSQDRIAAALARRDAEESQRRLEHADRLAALGKLAAGIAHEINNPIQAIYMNLLLLTRTHDSPIIQRVIEEIERITKLVASMREMYQYDVSEERLLNLGETLQNVVMLVKKALDSAKITVEYRLQKALPPVKASSSHVQQVIFNLILNARDAMTDGGTLTLTTIYDKRVDEVVLQVADTGDGISPDDLPRIFDPFYTTKAEGSGLGLSISQNIVVHYNGTLTVSSELGQGTAFELRFEAWKGDDE